VDEAALEKRKMINRERSPPSFVWENETNAIVALFSKKKKSKPFSKAIFDMDPKKFTRSHLLFFLATASTESESFPNLQRAAPKARRTDRERNKISAADQELHSRNQSSEGKFCYSSLWKI